MTMQRVLCSQITAFPEGEIMVRGWVERIRELKNVSFFTLRDFSGEIQVVVEGPLSTAAVRAQNAVEVRGRLVRDVRSRIGAELHATQVVVLGRADETPLVTGSERLEEPVEMVLDNRSFSLRNEAVRAVFKVQSEVVTAFRDFLNGQGFTEIHTPKLVAWGTEGGAELFSVDYFGQKAFLAQSPQFYKQMMVGSGLERVYEVGPVFRAEKHKTSRHINEYISLDVEMGFIDNLEELMNLEAELLAFIMGRLGERCPEALGLHGVVLPRCGRIPRISLAEAARLLKNDYNKELPGGQLDPEGERLLGRHFCEQCSSEFVFVTAYPVAARPMYALPDPKTPGLTQSFDLLFRGLEVTTGGLRIHEYDSLRQSMEQFGLNPSDFSEYLNVFRQGMPPHGGFAIGAERLTMQLLGLGNIREACLFPRDMGRLVP